MWEAKHKMNKVAIITDLHFGIKKANDLFLESQLSFYRNQFEPYLKKNGIKEIFVLGDIFDNRVSINIKIKNAVLALFGDLLKEYKIYMLIGNHDCFYTNSIETNSIKFLDMLKNVYLIDKNSIVELYNKKILLAPWIVNDKAFISEINNIQERIDVCMGHFAINGFYLNKFKIEESGMSNDSFTKFKKVFSGHFHTRSTKIYNDTEMIYIGSPYQLTRSDCNEERGFCILDMDTFDYEFIDNEHSLKYITLNYPEKFTKKMIEGNIIDVNVKFEKGIDDVKLQTYIKTIENFKPIVPPVIIPVNSFVGPDSVGDFEVKSASDLMKEYIEALDIDNKDEIYLTLEKLYEEARNTL